MRSALIFEHLFAYASPMSISLVPAVSVACARELDDLSVVDLQDLALELRTAAARLTGRLDEVLAELETRSAGMVRTNPDSDGPALFAPTRAWWRESSVISGGAAARDFRRAGMASRLWCLTFGSGRGSSA